MSEIQSDLFEQGSYIPASMKKPYLQRWKRVLHHFMPVEKEISKAIDALIGEGKEWRQTIAVDLDGTLAYYEGWQGSNKIGKPIPKMLARVKQWIEDGETIVIFTARADDPEAVEAIEAWLEENGIGGLRVTNVKDRYMKEFWDDRAIQIIPNTGVRPDEFIDGDKVEIEGKFEVEEAKKSKSQQYPFAFIRTETREKLFVVNAGSRMQAIFLAKKRHPSMVWLDRMIEQGAIEIILEYPAKDSLPPVGSRKQETCFGCGKPLVVITRSDGEKICSNCGLTAE